MGVLVRSGGWRGALMRKMVFAALGALIAGLLSAGPTAAEEGQPGQTDQPTTVAGLMGRYKDLSNQAERVNEDLLRIQEELEVKRNESKQAVERAGAARKQADDSRSRVTQAQQDKSRVDALMSSGGDLNALNAFLTSNSQADIVTRMQAASMASQLSGTAAQQGRIAIVEAERAVKDAAAAQTEARKTEAAIELAAAQVQRRRDELAKQIALVQGALERLTPQQKALLQDNGGSAVGVKIPDGDVGAVLRYALAQIGRPYVWGAIGPISFDCSGLMQTAYKTVGYNLPRVSIQQATVGQSIARADIRAGDMIFYYSPVHHVAMAIDSNRAVHAPSAGQNVKIAQIDAIGPITVIRRVMN
ncbi:cell wall-associated NlpC family hydrolase [Kibdelosporangium banguiense]|uniref:Cell wall-associated NlpC family hydrolase n=1 Tax=Kibdelosporangium banguiense TaxID=1365924 RepID=A0ABS4TQX4_9PSEU|nr:NlpC/P60 family protein [Kibdelosporangium banguiense]MBP2326276.1 cell wall-associated NlpC family hydrolase [Kibdelosporangium banguiense]